MRAGKRWNRSAKSNLEVVLPPIFIKSLQYKPKSWLLLIYNVQML
jgi:hypothetical protein